MPSLFEQVLCVPLAQKLRPKNLKEVVGQDHLLGEKGTLSIALQHKNLPSLILWGPPGCGKTTIAHLLARDLGMEFVALSAIFSGVADLKKIFHEAQQFRESGRPVLLFVDEIHRFNRAQQDAFLPYVEQGTITLVGATTENPSFELNSALLSRCQVLVLHSLSESALAQLYTRTEEILKKSIPLLSEAKSHLLHMAQGDGRYLLNMVEQLLPEKNPLTIDEMTARLQKKAPLYDKHEEVHYNLISALHKSLRGSDVDAALYWAARMLEGGEDPLYIARRLIRFAAEDIGMADPQALIQAMTARQCYEMLGSPEGDLAIIQAIVYLATAPKSNALYRAEKVVRKCAKATSHLMPPAHILNAPTKLMRDLGYGKDYAYDHDHKNSFSGQNYFPDNLPRETFFKPKGYGFEKEILKRLAYWDKLRKENGS